MICSREVKRLTTNLGGTRKKTPPRGAFWLRFPRGELLAVVAAAGPPPALRAALRAALAALPSYAVPRRLAALELIGSQGLSGAKSPGWAVRSFVFCPFLCPGKNTTCQKEESPKKRR